LEFSRREVGLQTKFDRTAQYVDDYMLFQYILGDELGIKILAYAQNSLFVRSFVDNNETSKVRNLTNK